VKLQARAAALRDLWRSRPSIYSRPLWTLMLGLDYLPWPWGEDILARLFAVVALVRTSRRRAARAWASKQPGRRGWRLALGVSAFRGRWVARSALLGMRRPDDFRRRVVVNGEEHLAATGPGGTILLGFHLGPPNVDVALRSRGHRLVWLGSGRTSAAWSRAPWRPFRDPEDNLCPADSRRFWPGYLYRARRILLDGGTIFVMADSWAGREFFSIALPGGSTMIRAGWLSLWRQTGARILPVLTHLDGRVQVITIHPPLPSLKPDDDGGLRGWQDILVSLVEHHVGRFPEQCPVIVFPATVRSSSRPAAWAALSAESSSPR
jgi:hypothetical protein